MENTNDKSWRIQSFDVFFEMANMLLDELIAIYEHDLKRLYTKYVIDKAQERYSMMMNNIYDAERELEKYKHRSNIDERKYREMKLQVLRRKAALASYNIEDWIYTSRYSDNFTEIILRAIIDELCDSTLLSVSFVSGNPNLHLTEDMIKDLIFVYSGIFSFDYWNDDSVSIISYYMSYCNEAPLYVFVKGRYVLNEDKIDIGHPGYSVMIDWCNDHHIYKADLSKRLRDRLDWFELRRVVSYDVNLGIFFNMIESAKDNIKNVMEKPSPL